MIKVQKIAFTLICISIISSIVFFWYNLHQYKTVGAYMYSEKTDCELVLPSNFKVVYSSENKSYAVQIITPTWGKQYLWDGRYITEAFDPETTFPDSCTAKSFAKEYLRLRDEETNNVNNYK